jgi:hypothetical protein
LVFRGLGGAVKGAVAAMAARLGLN